MDLVSKSGLRINIWEDPWVPWLENFVSTKLESSCINSPTFVSDLFEEGNHSWNRDIINNTFDMESRDLKKFICPLSDIR